MGEATSLRTGASALGSRLLASYARTLIDLRSLAGDREYRKFAIVGIARTGSTLLLHLLNSHGEVLSFGELFRSTDAVGWDIPPFAGDRRGAVIDLFQKDPATFLDTHVFRKWPARYRAVGFKIFYYHAQTPPHDAVWRYLDDHGDIAILHIVRQNILRQYLSLHLAHLTGSWSSNARAPEETPVRVDVEGCLRHFAYVRAAEEACRARFGAKRMIEIRYEDLVGDRGGEMARVQAFLGLSPRPTKTSLRRQQVRPLSSVIINYGELESACAGTPWASFFDA